MRAKKPYHKKRKRVGCGIGSGHGKRATRGQKGAGSRAGFSRRHGFEGGQTPFYRKTPKRGFNRPHEDMVVVNLNEFAHLEVSEITPEVLVSEKVIKNVGIGVKILGTGEISKPLTIKAHKFSISAKAKIEKAGGQAVVIA